MFVNTNDFRENNFFSVFVYILGKCSGKYSTLCVWSNVKQKKKKKLTPKTTGIHQNHRNLPPPPPPPPHPTTKPKS
jgi:hypothetical protein